MIKTMPSMGVMSEMVSPFDGGVLGAHDQLPRCAALVSSAVSCLIRWSGRSASCFRRTVK